jgi:crotonobetainyl-CoA:carnitine CoA-transferase CaiB-like acyl-CoA transferase
MEHPIYGDPNRRVGDDVLNNDSMFSYCLCINSGEKAVTLDLGTPGDLQETHHEIQSGYHCHESTSEKL